MGRSPRTVFPRTVPLVEAFRAILRAMCPDQPALADKIPTRSGWELPYPKYDITLSKRVRRSIRAKVKTAKKEMAKLKEARELFGGLVAREKLRLRGVLDPSKPLADIDPADAKVGVVDILAGELRVFLNNKLVRTYRQVHCYEIDVDRCAAELRSDAKPGKYTSPARFERFTTAYKGSLNGKAPPTEAEFTKAANKAGHYRPRKDLRAALATLGPRRPGPKSKSAGKIIRPAIDLEGPR